MSNRDKEIKQSPHPSEQSVVEPNEGEKGLPPGAEFKGVPKGLPPGAQFKGVPKGLPPRAQFKGASPIMPQSESSVDYKSILKRLIAYYGPMKILLIPLVLLVLLSCFLATICPTIMGKAIKNYIEIEPNLSLFLRDVVLLLILYGASLLFDASNGAILVRISNKVILKIREDAFNNIQRLSMNFFDKRNTGDVMSRLTNDIGIIENVMSSTILITIRSIFICVGAFIAMFLLNIQLFLIVFILAAFVPIITKKFGAPIREASHKNLLAIGALSAKIQEAVSGLKVIKSCVRENDEIKSFNKANEEVKKSGTRTDFISLLLIPVMDSISSLMFVLLVLIGGVLIVRNNSNLSVGILLAFIVYSKSFIMPLQQISMLYGRIQIAIAGAERVFEIMDMKSEIIEKSNPIPFQEGDIEFSDVHFAYEYGKPVLEGLNFIVPHGMVTAIVGPTGAGKTTLINLLCRFYEVNEGSIRINGTDIRDMEISSLRSSLGIVLQEPFFFATTVRENLLYGNQNATEEQMIEAARYANASHFISKLPKGYDTVLTGRGMNISEGERQLLAITRTILRNPSILILDEATSSIDSLIEAHIQQAIFKLIKGRTCLIIAHRLSTIKNADRILVIHNHRIIEEGTYLELERQKGFFAHLLAMQKSQVEIREDMI